MTLIQLCDENTIENSQLDKETRRMRDNLERTRLAELIKIDHPKECDNLANERRIHAHRKPNLVLEDEVSAKAKAMLIP